MRKLRNNNIKHINTAEKYGKYNSPADISKMLEAYAKESDIMSYLSDWAEQVKNRDRNCVICGSKQNLEAHHIFKVNIYDDAYFDLNNGITLCHSCHEKYHSRYGNDCNIKNLLSFKSEIKNSSHEKLVKNHGKVCNELRILSKKYNTLIKKHEGACSQNRDLEEKNKKLKNENKKLRRKMTKAYVNAFM